MENKKLTLAQIARASKIVVKQMEATIKLMDGQKLTMWKGLWNSVPFTPSLKKQEAKEFIQKHRGRPRKEK